VTETMSIDMRALDPISLGSFKVLLSTSPKGREMLALVEKTHSNALEHTLSHKRMDVVGERF